MDCLFCSFISGDFEGEGVEGREVSLFPFFVGDLDRAASFLSPDREEGLRAERVRDIYIDIYRYINI